MIPLNSNYAEQIRIKKNICAVNIMKVYQSILYKEKKIVRTAVMVELDKCMLKTIADELDKLIMEII